MLRAKWALVVCLFSLAGLVGCGSGSEIDTVPVTGKVTLDGDPVEGATVTFVPDIPKGHTAVGRTNRGGAYTLMTMEPGDGALPGSYRITVRKTSDSVAATTEYANPEEAQAAYREQMEAAGGAGGVPNMSRRSEITHELPARYADPGESGLAAKVTADGGNDFPLKLTSGE